MLLALLVQLEVIRAQVFALQPLARLVLARQLVHKEEEQAAHWQAWAIVPHKALLPARQAARIIRFLVLPLSTKANQAKQFALLVQSALLRQQALLLAVRVALARIYRAQLARLALPVIFQILLRARLAKS